MFANSVSSSFVLLACKSLSEHSLMRLRSAKIIKESSGHAFSHNIPYCVHARYLALLKQGKLLAHEVNF